jgi:hypothetical protein
VTVLALQQGDKNMTDQNHKATKVTLDTFVRAETDTYFRKSAASVGGIGFLHHSWAPASVEAQTVVRMNRDTLYSSGVFDLTTPLTLTFPDAGGRFMSLIAINQNHHVKHVTYEAGDHTLTAEKMGTRYIAVICRTFVDPNDPKDVATANALQRSIGVVQAAAGELDLPAWDEASLDACRTAVMGLGPFVSDSRHAFGDASEVDPIRHLIGTARGWGGNREKDALYLSATPEHNDGSTPYVLCVKDVPVDGFWSITVYNQIGYLEPNAHNAYSVNNVTVMPDSNGNFTIRFGGHPGAENYLHIMPGWNYTVRLYRPRPEVLDGSWTFPAATVDG